MFKNIAITIAVSILLVGGFLGYFHWTGLIDLAPAPEGGAYNSYDGGEPIFDLVGSEGSPLMLNTSIVDNVKEQYGLGVPTTTATTTEIIALGNANSVDLVIEKTSTSTGDLALFWYYELCNEATCDEQSDWFLHVTNTDKVGGVLLNPAYATTTWELAAFGSDAGMESYKYNFTADELNASFIRFSFWTPSSTDQISLYVNASLK